MGTETQQTGVTQPTTDSMTNTQPVKVEFTQEQQDHIQKVIDARFKKVSEGHSKELQTLQEQKAALEAELEAAKNSKGGKKDAEQQDEKQRQFADLLNQEKANTLAAKKKAEELEKENKRTQDEIMRIRKENAINRSAGNRFVDMEAVMAMTQSSVEWDDDSRTFVVRENGVIKQNSALQNMSLDEFYEDFAKKRPYLVQADQRGGAGSSESRGGGSQVGVVRSRADLKTIKEKSDYITKFGGDAFEALPAK
jgi:hypothetical protein